MNRVQSRSQIDARAEPASLAERDTAPLTTAHEFHGAVNALFSMQMEVGQAFGQDYRAWVLYTAFMVASAADTLRDAGGDAAAKEAERPAWAGEFSPGVLSAQSLSEMTGIPRETVRRKCMALTELGILKMDPSGYFRLEVNRETAGRAARRFARLNMMTKESARS